MSEDFVNNFFRKKKVLALGTVFFPKVCQDVKKRSFLLWRIGKAQDKLSGGLSEMSKNIEKVLSIKKKPRTVSFVKCQKKTKKPVKVCLEPLFSDIRTELDLSLY